MLALTPGHAFRTSLGFADHHAFDYLWLTLTALAVVVLTVETDVTVGSYDTTYEREIQTGANGNYSVTVPYASEYRVAGESVTVTETDVQNGTAVTVE